MKRVATVVSLFVLLLAATVIGSGPAEAGTSPKQKYVTVTRPYTQNWVFRSTSLRACVFVEVKGWVRGTHRYAYHSAGGTGWDTRYYYWYNTRLVQPSIRAVGWPISGAGCNSTRRVAFKKITLAQSWYEGTCHLSVGLSAGVPWSIQATPTYTCGKRDAARRTTSAEYPGAAGYRQANGGAPVLFKGSYLSAAADRHPFRANLRVTAYRRIGKGTVSDTLVTKRAVGFL
jgi:hypothetical protein